MSVGDGSSLFEQMGGTIINPEGANVTDERQPDYSARHVSTQHLMKWLVPNPRLNGIALDVAQVIWLAAQDLVAILDDGQELSAGLRKLREAKDCMVIQGLEDTYRGQR